MCMYMIVLYVYRLVQCMEMIEGSSVNASHLGYMADQNWDVWKWTGKMHCQLIHCQYRKQFSIDFSWRALEKQKHRSSRAKSGYMIVGVSCFTFTWLCCDCFKNNSWKRQALFFSYFNLLASLKTNVAITCASMWGMMWVTVTATTTDCTHSPCCSRVACGTRWCFAVCWGTSGRSWSARTSARSCSLHAEQPPARTSARRSGFAAPKNTNKQKTI